MKEYLIQYRPFLQFLGVFLLSYLILVGFYQLYLSQFNAADLEYDGFTNVVALQTKVVLEAFDYTIDLRPSTFDPSVIVSVGGRSIVRIVEGCNAISVMILFVAFILAFSKGFGKTLCFIAFGLLVIHFLNIFRIALLTIGIIKYPEYEHLLHGTVFPLVIYGTVFVLWIIWVTKFTKDVSKPTTA
ncbi:exosortase family protein XrtF [Flavobacterium tegetincola]|uniref:exosortase family protein XrtF n=1 Tax=Flavobacterium tegetincola TaxID=150172 RepID=UPI00041FDB5E|nr:exosortase family protein XrtF [Flavobacterium tegetincola]